MEQQQRQQQLHHDNDVTNSSTTPSHYAGASGGGDAVERRQKRRLIRGSKKAFTITKREYLKSDWCKTEPFQQIIHVVPSLLFMSISRSSQTVTNTKHKLEKHTQIRKRTQTHAVLEWSGFILPHSRNE